MEFSESHCERGERNERSLIACCDNLSTSQSQHTGLGIKHARNEISNSSSTSDSEANQPRSKRRSSNYVPDAIQVCDSITVQCSERFRFKGHLAAGQLLSKDNLPSFEKDFPDKI